MGPGLQLIQLFEIQDLFYSPALTQDLLLEQGEGVDQLFRTRWATGNIDIDGNNLVNPLDESVIIENSSRGRAGAHGNDPLGFWHLVI